MTWEEVAAFWRDMAERLTGRPDTDPTVKGLIQEGIRYRREEARMDRVGMSRWADDGGRVMG